MTPRSRQAGPVTTSPVSTDPPPCPAAGAGPGCSAPARGGYGVEGLVGLIATGALDEHLAVISRAIVERRRHLMRRESTRSRAAW